MRDLALNCVGTVVLFWLADAFIVPGCKLVYLQHKNENCIMTLQFQGELPGWFKQEDITTEILNVDYQLLEQFAVQSVCPCQPLDVTNATCSEDVEHAKQRLLSSCPAATSTVQYGMTEPTPSRHKYGPATSTSGTRAPATSTSGTSTPGTSTLGTSTSGTRAPGTSTPGTSTPATSTRGTSPPGTSPPGTSTRGTSTSGTRAPATSTSGTSTSGTRAPGTSTQATSTSATSTLVYGMTEPTPP
ncbi:hypothetical protein FHG87_004579 [Trinorchestia longiramus]|nr:hypothetical protein FHG87_004579 [Trinorchestia longiramus]